jgi:hypothetical protein
MQKQYASIETAIVDQTVPSGDQSAGQETSGIRDWSSAEDVPDDTGSVQTDASAIASLSGSAFVFDDSWLGKAVEATSLSGALTTADFTAALESVSAALSGYAADGVLVGATVDVPIWSLGNDDFSNF